MSDPRSESREKAEQHLDVATESLANPQVQNPQVQALVGIGYSLLHLADVVRRIGAYWVGGG